MEESLRLGKLTLSMEVMVRLSLGERLEVSISMGD
jgi:hypothetical protein